MKIVLTKDAVGLLYYILCSPTQLPLARAGMLQSNNMPREFICPDPKTVKKVAALRKWVREVVCEPQKEIDGKPPTGYEFRAHDGFLSETYCEQMRDILKHYQPMGGLVENTTVYSELCDVFDGRAHKLDSLDAMTRPDEDDEESTSKVTSIDEGKKDKEKKDA